MTGMKRPYIGLLEQGKRGKAMKPKTARRLAAALGCKWEDFYEENDDGDS